jgi:hypothetical protein
MVMAMPRRFLFAALLFIALLIAPVMGNNITITAEPLGGSLNPIIGGQSDYTVDVSSLQRNAIQRISVDVPTGSHVDYTVWYGNGTSLSGHMIYNSAPGMCGQSIPFVDNPCQYSEVSIGSSSSSHYYVGVQEWGRLDIIGYGRDETIPAAPARVFLIYDSSFGVSNVGIVETYLRPYIAGDALAFTPVPSGVIYKFHISSNKPLTGGMYYTNTEKNVNDASNKSLLDVINDWLTLINQIKDGVIQIFWFFYEGFFFFWDNIFLILILYIVITGAIATNQSKDIFQAIGKFFKYQQKIIEFFLGYIDKVTSLIAKFWK